MRWLEIREGQNYDAMFNDFINPETKSKSLFEKYITWARKTLKKNDRIVWFLRWVRVELAGRAKHTNSDDELKKLNKKLKTSFTRHDLIPISNLMSNLEHFLSMPIPQIQSVVWLNQSPHELLEEFKDLENEWKETSSQNNLIGYEAGDEPKVLIKFPDGYTWFDIETDHCDRESKAMGHCGGAGAQHGQTLLSLRKFVKTVGNENYYYPVLSFFFG